jgi:cytochrome c biogenesis protein
VTVSAEKGYLRETGNLLFHVALVALLVGVASGSLWGWKASVLVTEGNTFCDTVQAYDSFNPGARMRDATLPSFCVQLDDFDASYQSTGQPKSFKAEVRYIQGSKAYSQDPNQKDTLQVNHPLRLHDANVYLINHGYAPTLKYVDKYGTAFEESPAFLPQDGLLTSEGAFILPDANQNPKATTRNENSQIAFTGFFLPTAPPAGQAPTQSLSPVAKNPAVVLVGYRGDTGLDSGIAHSVYSLDQHQVDSGALKSIGSKKLGVGQTWKFSDGSSLTFEGYKEFMTVQVGHDPGEFVVLAAAVLMLVGLVSSLTVRRRRLFVRIGPDGGFAAGGLARTDPDRYSEEFHEIVDRLRVAADRTDKPAETLVTVGATDNPERGKEGP